MNAIGADGDREPPVARHQKEKAARAAQQGEVACEGAAIGALIMTEDNARAARQGFQRGCSVGRAGCVGQKPHHGQVKFELPPAVW